MFFYNWGYVNGQDSNSFFDNYHVSELIKKDIVDSDDILKYQKNLLVKKNPISHPSTRANGVKLDSSRMEYITQGVVTYGPKQNYSYDYNGRIIQLGMDESNQSPVFKLDERINYVYHPSGQIVTQIYSSHNGLTWDSTSKHISYLDSNFIEIRTLRLNWNAVAVGWDSVAQFSYEYDANYDLVEYREEFFNLSTGWIINGKLLNVYFKPGLLASSTVFNNNQNQLIPVDSTIIIYDGMDRPVSILHKWFITVSSSWKNNVYQTKSYGSSALIDTSNSFWWYNNSWQINYTEIVEFDAAYQLIREYYFDYNNVDSSQVTKYLFTHSYNPNLTIDSVFIWNGVKYESTSRTVKEYNSSNLLVFQKEYYKSSNLWVLEGERRVYYDNLDQIVNDSIFELDQQSNIVLKFAYDRMFDYAYSANELVYAELLQYQPGKLKSLKSKFNNETFFVLSVGQGHPTFHVQTTHYWSPVIFNSVIEQPQNIEHVYPNPATNYIKFESVNSGTCWLYDVKGNLVLHSQLPQNYLNIQHLKSGVYFYKLETNKGPKSGRFVKK